MRVFVAGATGAIGTRLLPLLLAGGHEVVAMTRRPEAATGLRESGVEAVIADALDRDAVLVALQRARPDVVMHQLTDLRGGSLASNAALRRDGTRNLVDAGVAAGVGRIVAQSICWIYEPGSEPATEDVALDLEATGERRVTVVGVAALEAAARELPEWVVLRNGWFYGPGTGMSPDGVRAEHARAGRLVADQAITSFVHVDDAAAAAAAALEWPTGVVNICDDEPAPGVEWVPAFCRAVGAPPPPVSDAARAPWARGASNRHAREQLGWSPRFESWREGFASFAAPSLP
jgi:nucleoside-diphosphate-sugar epimerase